MAGGVESLTRAPYVLPKHDRPFPAGHTESYSTTLGWRMVNPAMPPQWNLPLGESAELIAEKHGISREAQDAYALASHEKATRAWKDGRYDAEVVPVPVPDPRREGGPVLLTRDECVRENASLEAMAGLQPAFRPVGGTVTAGNSSPLDDGAAALLLAEEEGLSKRSTGRLPERAVPSPISMSSS